MAHKGGIPLCQALGIYAACRRAMCARVQAGGTHRRADFVPVAAADGSRQGVLNREHHWRADGGVAIFFLGASAFTHYWLHVDVSWLAGWLVDLLKLHGWLACCAAVANECAWGRCRLYRTTFLNVHNGLPAGAAHAKRHKPGQATQHHARQQPRVLAMLATAASTGPIAEFAAWWPWAWAC